ncbi:unnamed protein product [Kuraishia capsulata CBS 1993]|uniref:Major facilitator superfamily (MFS) profile domain-containing protein n=1 Tax=Kuraishia capsulata CBS 1993 TaxID=1382522 RepID=W6MMR1_9ASCO|nr:uncharacterized protein KUCA_T00002233001 [Kuraishia capsulata CBS 1993]CDK26262.1 unnamed protein product [Kuraishia capsulata CBS 1993]
MSSSQVDTEKFSTEHVESSFPDGSQEDQFAVKALQESDLTSTHREFLISRHGSVDLDPLPSGDPSEPINWPDSTKMWHLILLSCQAFTCTFMSAGISPAYSAMALQYGKTVDDCSYLTTAQLVCLGVGPLVWYRLMQVYGRKPVMAYATFGAMVTNIGGGFCKTYGQQMATRVLNGIFLSPACGLCGDFVASLFFAHERGVKNGLWSVSVIIGTPMGPFLMGFVVQHVGFKWIYFIFAIFNFLQFVGWAISKETLYERNDQMAKRDWKSSLYIKKYPNKSFRFMDIFIPLKLSKNFVAAAITFANSVVFCYANVVFIVETPSIYGRLFGLDSQQTALQYIPLIVGTVIGELIAGKGSDIWMERCVRKRGGVRVPADRLILSYLGIVCTIAGLIVWGVCLKQATPGVWNVKPSIGTGVAAAGADIVLTITITFLVDNTPWEANNIGLFLPMCRLILGFISPFYFPKMFENLNYAGSAGFMAGMCLVAGIVIAIVHFQQLRRLKK